MFWVLMIWKFEGGISLDIFLDLKIVSLVMKFELTILLSNYSFRQSF
jgi:hypothetical protein